MIRLRRNRITDVLGWLAAAFLLAGYAFGIGWAAPVGWSVFALAFLSMIYLTYGKIGCIGAAVFPLICLLFAYFMSIVN